MSFSILLLPSSFSFRPLRITWTQSYKNYKMYYAILRWYAIAFETDKSTFPITERSSLLQKSHCFCNFRLFLSFIGLTLKTSPISTIANLRFLTSLPCLSLSFTHTHYSGNQEVNLTNKEAYKFWWF